MVTFKGSTISECLDIASKAGVSKAPILASRVNGQAKAVFDVKWHQLRRN